MESINLDTWHYIVLFAAITGFGLAQVPNSSLFETGIISEDPYLLEMSAVAYENNSIGYDPGPWSTIRHPGGMPLDNTREEPEGKIVVNNSHPWLVMFFHPRGEGPINFRKEYLKQDVLIPITGEPRIVATARNINHLSSVDTPGCEDSFFIVKLEDRITSEEHIIGTFTARKEPETFNKSIGEFKGRPVTMILEIRPGGECGIWNGERAAIEAFYIRSFS